MTDNRFKQGQYEDALQFTKDILSNSYTVDDIVLNTTAKDYSKDIANIKDDNNK